jgi:hypothetical protein
MNNMHRKVLLRQEQEALLAAFQKGRKVRYVGHAHGRHGQIGTVVRPVKSRQVVTLNWDNDPYAAWFDAIPQNLEIVQ